MKTVGFHFTTWPNSIIQDNYSVPIRVIRVYPIFGSGLARLGRKKKMFNIPGGIEWFILLGIAFLVFGGRLLRTFGAAGKSFLEFRNAARDVEDDIKKTTFDNIVEGMIYNSDIDKNKCSGK